MRFNLPYHSPGQRIGLLGGSFDPPHVGHVHISHEALKRFGLDQVWWLVSPGNPLKARGPAPLEQRLQACRGLLQHPRIHVSDFEAQAGTRYTAQTLAALQKARPKAQFVWLMGADNLTQFDQWQDWRQIMERVPIGVMARPGQRIAAQTSRAARIYDFARLRKRDGQMLGQMQAPAWCFVNVPMMNISSTGLRQSGAWNNV
ncbi:nicotinate-nucleotide adenylyltransferase [Roseovarius sp. EL26]|uniref:nicotinate-nucleotide adenylyltransferase n=1 Tax=Roseovarius sp. EL26 TaxID=2126672 RepID=UPI000EA258F6|nr:nicotinate-nucleotide adenylyltransferase [Roseovarius sp. EL26]